MLQKYIILWFLFHLLVKVNCQAPLRPLQRHFHSATLINNKLYVLAGSYVFNNVKTNEFINIDVSAPFNTKELIWQNLTNINIVPAHVGATVVKGGANNNTLILNGGRSPAIISTYTFDPQSNSWNTPKVAGEDAVVRSFVTGIIDYSGKMYLFSGAKIVSGNLTNDLNDMIILDTINLSWKKGSLVNAPSPRHSYGAVLLPNNNIIYFGGFNIDNNIELTLNQIFIYNIISDSWDTKAATGTIPSARNGFSAVLGLDGQRVIIFGGTATFSDPLSPKDSLYTLDLSNFGWSIPKTSGNFLTSRMHHTANVIGRYMVVAFGSGYDQSEGDILLLDISNNENYVWTDTFDPPSSSGSAPSATSTANAVDVQPSNSNKPSAVSIIGAIVGSLIGGSLLTIGVFFLYKWKKDNINKREDDDVIRIPGSNNYYDQAENGIYRNNNYTAPAPVMNRSNMETNPIANDEISSLRQEIQGLKQVILQNNVQQAPPRPNVPRNMYYYD